MPTVDAVSRRMLRSSALIFIALAACGTEPTFIAYDATVVSPNGAEGAVVLELDGSFAEAISVGSGRVFTSARNDVTRVVLVRSTPGELTFTMTLDAPAKPPTVRLLQVADGANQLRAVLRQYRVEFTGIGQ